jgi:hypothetical protein
MNNSVFTSILAGITFVIAASYMPCWKARAKRPPLRHLTMRHLCAYTGLVQKNSCGLRNYGYVDARLAKTTLGERKMGDRKMGGESEGQFSRLPFSCSAGRAPINSI